MTPKQQFLGLCSIVLSVLAVGAAVQDAELVYFVLSVTSAVALVYCATIEPRTRGSRKRVEPAAGFTIKPPADNAGPEPDPPGSLDSWIGGSQ